MLNLSTEAIAWTVTLVVALAIAGLVAATTWRWRQRPSAYGLAGRDVREGSKRPMLQEPGSQSTALSSEGGLRSAISSEAGHSTWAVSLMRATFSTLSTIFGALGISLLYLSWFTQAEFSAYALILLGSATCIVFSLQHGAWVRKR